jgi:hypothetical protein
MADKNQFVQGKKDLAHIEMKLHDEKGNPVHDATNEMTVSVEGPCSPSGPGKW